MIDDSELRVVSRRLPEHRLLAGILLLAIQDFIDAKRLERWKNATRTPAQSKEHQKQLLHDSAKGWITSNSEEPFSFCWICQHLSLHPRYIRKRILAHDIDMPNTMGTCCGKESYWAETGRVRDVRG